MTIKGDLVAALSSRGYSTEDAAELLKFIFDMADTPDFAERFAADFERDPVVYYEVIAFLKQNIGDPG